MIVRIIIEGTVDVSNEHGNKCRTVMRNGVRFIRPFDALLFTCKLYSPYSHSLCEELSDFILFYRPAVIPFALIDNASFVVVHSQSLINYSI